MKHVLIMDVGKDLGGAETYIMQLINGLPLEDYQCFLCIRAQSAFAEYLEKQCINTDKFYFDFSCPATSLKQLRQFVEEKNIDLIHCNGINSMIVFRSAQFTAPISAIATIHGDAVQDRMGRPVIERMLFAKAEIFLNQYFKKYIAVSADLKTRLVNRGVPEKKVIVIHNGVDLNQYPPKEERCHFAERTVHILSIGRLEKVKNYELLLSAVESCIRKANLRIHCDIYGTGSQLQALQKIIAARELNKTVTLKGYVVSSAIDYSAYDIYVQPSHYESFGLAVVEAMLNRVLCLTSSVGGMREINAVNSKCCFADNDMDALTDLIIWVSNLSDSYLNKLEQNAEKYVRTNFNHIRMLKETMAVYEQCCRQEVVR